MTVPEARALVRDNPGRWRAAYVEAPGVPLLDHPQARVRLHPKIGQAQDELRARKECLVKSGWQIEFGSLGKSLLVLRRGSETRALAVDRAPRVARGRG